MSSRSPKAPPRRRNNKPQDPSASDAPKAKRTRKKVSLTPETQESDSRAASALVKMFMAGTNVPSSSDDDDEAIPKVGTIFIRRTTLPDTITTFLSTTAIASLEPPQAEEVGLKQLVAEREKELLEFQARTKLASASLTLRERILLSGASNEIKTVLFRKLREAYGQSGESPVPFSKDSAATTSETIKTLGWINTVLSFPFGICKPIVLKGTLPSVSSARNKEIDLLSHLRYVKDRLDRQIYKHDRAKTAILGFLGRMLYSQQARSNLVMLLVGPPAVGKTRLARVGVSEALGLPFQVISLAGVKDSAVVVGHSPTYIGARPGRIVNALIQAKSLRCCVFLDEIDKIGGSTSGVDMSVTNDVTSALLQATDEASSHEWEADCFFAGLKLDLSNVVWFAAANDQSLISPILRDRMTIVEVDPLTTEDRIEILSRITFPETLQELGMIDQVLPVSSRTARHIMARAEEFQMTGMRDLRRLIWQILERLMLVRMAFIAGEIEQLGELFTCAQHPLPAMSFPLMFTTDWIDYLVRDLDGTKGKQCMSSMYS